MKKKTARKIELFLHFITALLLIIKGVDELTRGLYYPALIILGLALLVLIIIVFRKQLRIRPKQARIICWYSEAPALLVTSYMLHLEKREFTPHIFLIAAIIYPAMGFISSKRFKRIKKTAL